MGIPFTTEVKVKRSSFNFTGQTPVITLGSCFSDHIGGLLLKHKFFVRQNPFGVLYNPFSISKALRFVLENVEVGEEDLVFHNDLWHSFFFHGSFSSANIKEVLKNTNDAIRKTRSFLKKTDFLFVTFGTAWVYQYLKSGTIVANCHKIPAAEFRRFRLTVEDIFAEWETLIFLLKEFNPNLKIIFTVSPIRHLKDGAHENQLSKSVLFLAIDKLMEKYNHLEYFPSYEIVHDELRDYRFYTDDMLHISEKAIRYLFGKFRDAYFTDDAIEYFNDMDGIVKAVEHRILTANENEAKKFAANMLKRINMLQKKYPYVNFQLEKNHFENL